MYNSVHRNEGQNAAHDTHCNHKNTNTMKTAIGLPAVARAGDGAGVCDFRSCDQSVLHCHKYV